MRHKALLPVVVVLIVGSLVFVLGNRLHSPQSNGSVQQQEKNTGDASSVSPAQTQPVPALAKTEHPKDHTGRSESKSTPEVLANTTRVDASHVGQVSEILRDPTQTDTARNEAINLLRRSNYKGLPDDLIRILNDPNEGERFRRFCVQHLGIEVQKANNVQKQAVLSVLQECLSDRHLGVRREALLALVNAGDPTGKEKAVEWLVAENADDTRDLAIRCVQQMDLKEYIPEVRKYVYDDNEVTRIAAIVALSQWGDEESRPAFVVASKSENVRIQRAGKAALERLDKTAPNLVD